MTPSDLGPIDVVLPAHNEAGSIGATIQEFHDVASARGFDVRFVVCEDGSTDGTTDIVRELSTRLPVTLLSSPERKGYSRAVIDGLRATTAGMVCFIDSDGQCDPNDLGNLAEAFNGVDLVVGYRNPRADTLMRKMMSGAFRVLYERLFAVRLTDPSCPYLLISQPALRLVLTGNLGILKQGFWWEFNARAEAAGLTVREIPVQHRVRAAGQTQVYRLNRIPRIATEHVLGLWKLRADTSSNNR
jgi:glycosyltransferase involved in cell wall biosynthesis